VSLGDAAARDARGGVWTRYWATGTPHSCGGSWGETYGGALGAYWRAVFSSTQPGDRVLDVATGNGALPRLLLEVQPDVGVSIDAVDLARIAPAWLGAAPAPQAARVRFHGGVQAESLPFDAATFALAVSQYGIEYTDLDRTVPEVLRVLAPRGRVRIVAHHHDARPVLLAAEEIGHIDWLLSPGGLLDLAQAMCEPMARAATPEGRASLAVDSEANALRARFNDAQQATSHRIEGSGCPDVLHDVRGWIAQAFGVAGAQGTGPARAALDQARRLLADARLRLDELRGCALDLAGAEALCTRLRAGGGQVRSAVLRDGDHVLGWAVEADTP
jgi:SAM-dependent methyltransferase